MRSAIRRPLTRGQHAVRTLILLAVVAVFAWLSLATIDASSLVPIAWPAAGVAAGVLLTTRRELRSWLLVGLAAVLAAAHLLQGYPVPVAAGFTASCLAEVFVVRRGLVRHHAGRRMALMDEGDVSALVGTVARAAAAAAAGYALTDWVTGHGNPWLALLGVWGTHAAALMLLLPLFLPVADFEPIAGHRERVTQWILTVGTTVLVFSSAAAPPVVFVVMPMFAWLAFRGTLREATVLLNVVAGIGTVMTALHLGPVWVLGAKYDLPNEVVIGILQLFLLDCGLIMLPLSVAVTQQRMAIARAAAGRETLERLVSSATGTAIVAIDTTGRITLFNPGAEAMLGHLADDVLGQTPDRFHPPAELRRMSRELGTEPTFLDVCVAVVASDQPRRLWRFTGPGGDERSMLMTLTPIPGEDGGTSGYLSTAEDVTEREGVQAALEHALAHERAAVDRLEELDQVRANFVSTVSHELRTPITSIIGYTELLEDGAGGELSPGQRNLISRVERNSRRLLLLIEDLLTLSRIEAAELTMDPVVTDLRGAVHRACEALAVTLRPRDLTLTVSLPDHEVRHDGDPVQLERMVLNLLTNAVKFTPDGGTVGVEIIVGETSSELVVRDTGVGIPEAEQDRLFTRFFRSTTATQLAIQGTGLGLSIVHAIVTLHGGEIDVVSSPAGTEVTVVLPRLVAPAEPAGSTVVPPGIAS